MSVRATRMIDSAPGYYQQATLYKTIQEDMATEFDNIEANNDDLQKQLYIITATWGLKHWERTLGIPVNEQDSYEIRRSRVLAKWRGIGNFGVDLIKSVCEAFTNGDVDVRIRIPEHEIIITFVGTRGIPPNIEDLKTQVENLIHAHLGVQWKFRYLVWEELDSYNLTWHEFDALNLTWDELHVYTQ